MRAPATQAPPGKGERTLESRVSWCDAHAPHVRAQVSIWHVDMGSELMSLAAAMESVPLCCAFSTDDSKLAITESNGNVTVWNVVAGCQW